MPSSTRQKLVIAALDLMSSSSYGSMSVDGICAAAGARKGSFYHFFPSKADLAIAAMEEDTRRSLETYEAAFKSDVSPLERFFRLSESLVATQASAAKRLGHVPGCPVTSVASEMAGQSEEISRKFEEVARLRSRFFESAVTDLIIEGQLPATTDVRLMGRQIHSVVLGALVMARIENDTTPLGDSLKEAIIRTLGIQQ
jgi:TetR/AcrR family transcriptional repressor of nem operon